MQNIAVLSIILGIKSALVLSDGVAVENPKPLKKESDKNKENKQTARQTHTCENQAGTFEGRKKVEQLQEAVSQAFQCAKESGKYPS